MKTNRWCNHMKKVVYICACSECLDVVSQDNHSQQQVEYKIAWFFKTHWSNSSKHRFLMLIPSLQLFLLVPQPACTSVLLYTLRSESQWWHIQIFTCKKRIKFSFTALKLETLVQKLQHISWIAWIALQYWSQQKNYCTGQSLNHCFQ